MRIAFDGTALRPWRTGVGYYTEHLLHHLAEEAIDDDLIVISNRPIDTIRPLPERVRVVAPMWRVPRLVWMQTLALRTLGTLQTDVGHFTNGMLPLIISTPAVVTRAARETLSIYRQAARQASTATICEPVAAFAKIGEPPRPPQPSRETRQPWAP